MPALFSPLRKNLRHIFSFLFLSIIVLFIYFQNKTSQSTITPISFDYFSWKQKELKNIQVIKYSFKKNETLLQVLMKNYEIPSYLSYKLAESFKKVLPLNKIKPGDQLKLVFEHKALKQLIFSPSPEKNYIFTLTPFGIALWIKEIPTYTFLDKVEGEIKTNLYASILENKIDPELGLELADIFSWDINFFVDIRPGDKYRFIYEKIYIDGKFLRYGRILAAQFLNKGKLFEAYYFKTPDGRIEYYDAEGRPLRKAFLKSPLRYKRISSHFSYHRLHPILGIIRPHLGIDYAAPIGTPVEAVADGKIIYMGWKGDYGKFIKIRHTHRYVSTYGHLSRFAKGLKVGSRVKQGQVIGYVGSTGLATGPHLDFRFLVDNKFVDYLKFKSPPVKPLPSKYLNTFKKQMNYLRCLLEKSFDYAMLKSDVISH